MTKMNKERLQKLAEKAVAAQRVMLGFSSRKKRDMLYAIADELEKHRDEILAVNRRDVSEAVVRGRSSGFLDRLTITELRFGNMVRAFRVIADSKDPIGEQISRWIRPNGLEIIRKRVPIGVVGLALESRPHVVALASAVCFKVNNAVMVVSDDEAKNTNELLAKAIRTGGAASGLPGDALQLVCSDENLHDCRILTSLEGLVDVAILRGSNTFVNDLVEHAKIPVLKHCGGLCHVYVDCDRKRPEADAPSEEAQAATLGPPKVIYKMPSRELEAGEPSDGADSLVDIKMALDIVFNSRCYEPYACNTANVVLVHRRIAPKFLPALAERAGARGVELHGDEAVRLILPSAKPADADEWRSPRKEMVLTIGIVDSIEAAVSHINECGSHLSDSIVSEDLGAQNFFMRDVDSAAVYANASTCFSDGGEFGMGAEIGLSSDKLNARGPIGLEDLTSTKYMVHGNGQTRG